MQKVVTAEEMREIDRLTTERYGIPSILLMENAAHAAARVITEKLGGSVKGKSFLILCGKGNNGGDGAALARILWTQGAKVFVHCIFDLGKLKEGDSKTNFRILDSQYKISFPPFDVFEQKRESFENLKLWQQLTRTYWKQRKIDCIIDALFGTGLTQPLQGIYGEIPEVFKGLLDKSEPLLISLDIPSGLNANSAEVIGKTFTSNLTITFTAPKPANVLPPASNFNGELVTVNIGSPYELIENSPSQLYLAESEDAQEWLLTTKFTENSYKKTRGHCLLIVGSKNMSGAAVLAGNAAMVSGIGLTTIATSESALNAVSTRVVPEVMIHGLAETESGAISKKSLPEILKLSEKADVVGIGCGLSSEEEETREFVREIVKNRKTPMVLDADALNALAPFQIEGNAEFPLILTPHEGEFLRLLGTTDKEVLRDRISAVREFAQRHKVILVLKGERTLISEPSGKVVVNPTGNSGLGKAGNGDTLTGIITGFLAQTFAVSRELTFYTPVKDESDKINRAFEAVVAAVYLAGLAGDIAEKKYGKRSLTASDVRECLGESFRQVEQI